MTRSGPQLLLQSALLLATLCLVIMSTAVHAYKFGDFPEKGNREVWIKSNNKLNAALALGRSDHYDEAISKLQDIIASYPYDAGYSFNLGVCYEARNKPGDLKRAEQCYKQSTVLAPSYWETWNGLARAQYQLREYDDARASFARSLQAGPPADLAPDIKKSLEIAERHARSVSR